MTDFNYTVKQNDSLSKIFLEQAKLKDSSLDSKKIDWNKVINVFEEIQAEEAKEGQRIYRSNPNVIWSGDKISLSENQMNRIYEAMGLEISPAEDPPASGGVDDPENPQAPQEPQKPQEPQDPDNASNRPPQQDPNPPKDDPNPPTKCINLPMEKDPNPPSSSLIENMCCPDRKNSGYRDQLTGLTYVYDENGYVTDIYDANGNKTREITRHEDYTVSDYTDYEYDANGNKTREIRRHDDGTVYGYDNYEYDEQGNIRRTTSHFPNGYLVDAYAYTDYEYDANGNRTRTIDYDVVGRVCSYTDYEYDNNNNLIRQTIRDCDGFTDVYLEYKYGEKGSRTCIVTDIVDGSTLETYEETLVNGEWQRKDE